MIQARDWLIFLKNDVPLEDLPIPEEHLPFVKTWLQNRDRRESKRIFQEIRQLLQSYPRCVFERHNTYDCKQEHTADPLIEVEHLKVVRVKQPGHKSQKRFPVAAYVEAPVFEKIEEMRGNVERSCFLAKLIEEELSKRGS